MEKLNNILDPRIDILGNSSIGIFGFSTDTYTFLPNTTKSRVANIAKSILKTDLILTSLSNSNLNGLFAIGNKNHILLPHLVSESELNSIQVQISSDVSLHVIDSKITAFGNTIVCNDKIAIVHKEFSIKEKKLIGDYLDVEILTKSFLDNSLLGSMIFLSSKGFLTHPLFEEEDLEWLSAVFGVKGDVVTVNRGTPYPRLGIIANKNGILIGSDTTGPEIMRISSVLN